MGGAALLRLYPSYGGWGPNSLQVLTKTPFIIVYQAYDYIDMIISCKALQWVNLQLFFLTPPYYKWIGLGLGLGWDLCAGLFYEHRFVMLITQGVQKVSQI